MSGTLLSQIATLVAVLGSATGSVPVPWVMLDKPEEARIEIRFSNNTAETLCISEGDWPTSGGKLNYAGRQVALVVDAERFPIRDFDTGYCDAEYTECVVRVLPGKTITGSLSYEEFNLPNRLWSHTKRLIYPLTADNSCR